MKRAIVVIVAALALAGAGAVALHAWPIGNEPRLGDLEGDAQRGAYLARAAGCIACHTDREGGGAPLAGGVKLETGFGTFHSPNLTTDPQNGIGDWTPELFSKAVRQGISPEGDPYYPAFPYPFYASLSDQDIADLWAAFQTVPAVADPSVPQELSFPYNYRTALKAWRALFLDADPLAPVEGKSEAWNRGRFLVKGPAHCGACHTPRNLLGARQVEMSLNGATELPGGGKSPPITAEYLHEQGWTVDTLKYALRTGILPDGDAFGGSMGEVVRDSTTFLNDRDLTAIAIYLLDEENHDEETE